MSDLKAEMTISLNTSNLKEGVKSINADLDDAGKSAKNLGNELEFKDVDTSGLNSSLKGTKKALDDVSGKAEEVVKSLNHMADTKRFSILNSAIKGCFQGIGQFVSMASLGEIKQGFTSAITLGLDFMKQSDEGQKTVARWQGKIEDLKNGIGELVANALEKMEPFIDWTLDAINEKVIPAFQDGAKIIYSAFSDYIDPFFKKTREAWEKYGIPVVAGFMTAWTKSSDSGKLALKAWQLSFVQTFETVKYWLKEVVPGSIKWFAKFVKINFTTIGENIKQVFANVGQNITDFLRALKDVAMGRGWNFQGTAVSKDLRELDNVDYRQYVSRRQKSESEKTLEKEVNALAISVNEGYDKNVKLLRQWAVAVKGDERKSEPEDNSNVLDSDSDGRWWDNPNYKPEIYTEESQKATTEGLVAAYDRINNAVANSDPVVDAIQNQMEMQEQLENEILNTGKKALEYQKKSAESSEQMNGVMQDFVKSMKNPPMVGVVTG